MKAVILAGGRGARISEESLLRPKPMIDIGEMPILWHIMKNYQVAGVTDFIILVGYKGSQIKEFFLNYHKISSSVKVDLESGTSTSLGVNTEPWKVEIIDTGLEVNTGGRLLRAKDYLPECFYLTYGDGLSDLNVTKVYEKHQQGIFPVTLTAVRRPGRFGSIQTKPNSDVVSSFTEKPTGDNTFVNGGFYVVNREILEFINSDEDVLEKDTFSQLVQSEKIQIFRHEGFWHPMDTIHDREYLQSLWESGSAPWKQW